MRTARRKALGQRRRRHLNRPEGDERPVQGAPRGAAARRSSSWTPIRTVRVIVLTRTGERAFTAGLDLKELSTDPLGMGAAGFFGSGREPGPRGPVVLKPIIGAINGVAITRGFEVALACDVLLCSTNARFADTHARVEHPAELGPVAEAQPLHPRPLRQGAGADRQLPLGPASLRLEQQGAPVARPGRSEVAGAMRRLFPEKTKP